MVKGPQLKVCECRIARSSPSAAVAAIFQAKKRTGTGLIPQIFASMKPSQCQKQSLRRDDLSPTPRRSVGFPEAMSSGESNGGSRDFVRRQAAGEGKPCTDSVMWRMPGPVFTRRQACTAGTTSPRNIAATEAADGRPHSDQPLVVALASPCE